MSRSQGQNSPQKRTPKDSSNGFNVPDGMKLITESEYHFLMKEDNWKQELTESLKNHQIDDDNNIKAIDDKMAEFGGDLKDIKKEIMGIPGTTTKGIVPQLKEMKEQLDKHTQFHRDLKTGRKLLPIVAGIVGGIIGGVSTFIAVVVHYYQFLVK